MASYLNLTSVFEYIADAGYIAYNEEFSQTDTSGAEVANAGDNLLMRYKWQEKKFNSKYKLLKKENIYRYLFPRLSAKD
jgi:hypothetical protein